MTAYEINTILEEVGNPSVIQLQSIRIKTRKMEKFCSQLSLYLKTHMVQYLEVKAEFTTRTCIPSAHFLLSQYIPVPNRIHQLLNSRIPLPEEAACCSNAFQNPYTEFRACRTYLLNWTLSLEEDTSSQQLSENAPDTPDVHCG
jgi:hypothetical protein